MFNIDTNYKFISFLNSYWWYSPRVLQGVKQQHETIEVIDNPCDASYDTTTTALIPDKLSEALVVFKNVLNGQERPNDNRYFNTNNNKCL